jgi:hypothetical protein
VPVAVISVPVPPLPPPLDGIWPPVRDPGEAEPRPVGATAMREPLVPLFVPYCGGVSQRRSLETALDQLLVGEWSGERRLEGGALRAFRLRWHGEPAPLEPLGCELQFPDLPTVHYDFSLPAYRLVLWLMRRQERQLPVSFWRWLLLGELPRANVAAAPAGDAPAVA